jgi:hypothetical protein
MILEPLGFTLADFTIARRNDPKIRADGCLVRMNMHPPPNGDVVVRTSYGWSTGFDHLTVRQFINRLADHMAPQTTWIWQGGKEERMFTFFKGGFHAF